MSSDLRRPSDEPRPPDEPPGDPPDRPPRLSDSYVDDPEDIFDTTDIPKDRTDSTQRRETERPPADDAGENHRVDVDSSSEADEDVDEPFEFDPRRASLDDMTAAEAAAFIATNKGSRPWLAAAEGHHPQVQRVYAALDTGRCHATPRHNGYGDASLYERRVSHNEDPAQLDDARRAAGIDGTKPGDKKHFCAPSSTRIHDVDAFATAFARGIEHPDVRAVLDRQYDKDYKPPRVFVPISDLLGENGHEHCSGFQLVGTDPEKAFKDREAWLNGERRDDLIEPAAEPIATFDGGSVEFRFGRNLSGDGYEVMTMSPPSEQTRGRTDDRTILAHRRDRALRDDASGDRYLLQSQRRRRGVRRTGRTRQATFATGSNNTIQGRAT